MDQDCVRRAWLTLGSSTIDLQDEAGGWFCTSLDLGYPEVRAVVNNRPDAHGIDDRTRYFGQRVVSADVVAVAAAGAVIDDVAENFAPFMVPSSRPTLHYVLDRPGTPERAIVLRASGYDWKVEGVDERNIHLQWVAADPAIYDATVQVAVSYAGSTTSAGRTYDLTFPRVYPTGGGVATTGRIQNDGDLDVNPLLRIYGPITAPNIQFIVRPGNIGGANAYSTYVRFAAGFIIDAGHWVDVDTDAKTAYRDSDPAQPCFSSLNFAATTWATIPPGHADMILTGSGASNNITQVQAFWQNAYLT